MLLLNVLERPQTRDEEYKMYDFYIKYRILSMGVIFCIL
jgi:hypothetical protein